MILKYSFCKYTKNFYIKQIYKEKIFFNKKKTDVIPFFSCFTQACVLFLPAIYFSGTFRISNYKRVS
jgi:hypothetical protein